MSVLILKNISTEGPGTIEDYLRLKGIPYAIVDLYKGESLPDATAFDTLIMLGGPMSVNDDISYIRKEEDLVRDFASAGKKMLGVCLGAQIMAKALGAKVYKGPAPEIGWLDIILCEEGLRDSLMLSMTGHTDTGEICKRFKVFHWHGETFDIPPGASRLASSDLYPNQAFRYGSGYALQFHIEVSEQIIYDWMSGEKIDMIMLQEETERHYDAYHKRAFTFYEKFFNTHTI
jgi:GMP synthase-like glutamine amidotransferase